MAGILVGGGSTRMGRPKANLPLPNGRTLVEHVMSVAQRAGPWMEEAVILGQVENLPTALAQVRVLVDAEPGSGPLAGLATLLQFAAERWGLLLACDLPLLQPALLERLRAGATRDCDAVAFRRSDRPTSWHGCCALYHPRLAPMALRALREGPRSLQSLLAAARVSGLDAAPEEQCMLMNLNTPQEYERLFDRP